MLASTKNITIYVSMILLSVFSWIGFYFTCRKYKTIKMNDNKKNNYFLLLLILGILGLCLTSYCIFKFRYTLKVFNNSEKYNDMRKNSALYSSCVKNCDGSDGNDIKKCITNCNNNHPIDPLFGSFNIDEEYNNFRYGMYH